MATNNSILYLLSYNNYFNRIVKRENTVEDYLEFSVYEPLVCNFNPADGINTEHIFNTSYLANTPEADYVLVIDATTREINSRWFIIGASRQRGGQYHLSLRRDLAADFYDNIINAPCYIEKATIPTISSPLIFNSERFFVNQIKKGETLLKDKTGCGWLVGYVSTADIGNISISIPNAPTVLPTTPIEYDSLVEFMNVGAYKDTSNWNVEYKGNLVPRNDSPTGAIGWGITCSAQGATYSWDIHNDTDTKLQFARDALSRAELTSIINTQLQQKKTDITTALYNYNEVLEDRVRVNETVYNTLLDMNGNNYTDGVRTFSVTVEPIGETTRKRENITSGSGAAYTILNTIIDAYTTEDITMDNSGISFDVVVSRLNISIADVSLPPLLLEFTNSVKILQDAPYRMFACPVGSPNTTVDGFELNEGILPNISKKLCSTLATALGGTGTSFIYDLQYLPYCPARELINEKGWVDLSRGTQDKDYSLVKDTSSNLIVQYLLWCNNSSFSFTINSPIPVPANVVEFKVAHETQFCRLVSPNYNGSFEFKPTSNRGVTGFEVNATYRPYQPYIHLNPIFNQDGLYGGDYNDERGLVCSGNFSVDIIDDAWIDYQIQNKSYADAFNRQIENMETTHKIQMEQQKTAGIVSATTAGISGSTTGTLVGSAFGPIGTAVGATVGAAGAAIASGVGAAQDLKYAQQLHEESKSYTQDIHNLSLQNIQALPYTLGKVSAFTTNNKIFPFVEFYDATEEEKEILRNKLYFDGMTIGAIGSISNYIGATPSFISAQLLRITTIPEDYHLVAELANELHKGYYI